MATVEHESAAAQNGGGNAIAVENPATGATIGHVPNMGPDEVARLAERARRAQPGWDAIGFDGRAEVMHEFRRWLVRNRDRLMDTIVSETGKAREDALVAEIFIVAEELKFWAKRGQRYLK